MKTTLNQYLDELLKQGFAHNIAVRVGIKDDVLLDVYHSDEQVVDSETMFDMASVTKILATTTLSLMAIDKGLLKTSDKVSRFFSVPDDFKDLTVQHLLTHTMGIGHRALNFPQNNYDNIAEFILSLEHNPVGAKVEYSCPAFILLGKILEKIYGKRLDILFKEKVAEPLNMKLSTFLPDKALRSNMVNSNLDPDLKGVVNDYNCQYLGGVAGNAGVFSCVEDMTKFAKMLISNGYPLISKTTFDNATKNHTEELNQARALGYLYVDEGYSQTGKLFPNGSFGHCGHTGTSIFVNKESGLYVIILSDATISAVKKYGKEHYSDVEKMRENIHNLIKEELNL